MSIHSGMTKMRRTFVIDCLPESVIRYQSGWTVVVVDVIRATTTAVTAVSAGRRCFPVPTVESALELAGKLENPVLAGETSGIRPHSFEMDNSPAQLASRTDHHRPLVLVSSSGTKVIHGAAEADAVYLGCYRNYSALTEHLASRHSRVAIIGAGSKGEFREEDQICCGWIGAGLAERGYAAASRQTSAVVERWRRASADACLCSRSVDFLKRTGQLGDLSFILSHVDDLNSVFRMQDGEVQMAAGRYALAPGPWERETPPQPFSAAD